MKIMKNGFFKFKTIQLILLSVIIITIGISCSSDNNETELHTFLEIYSGTKWGTEGKNYFKFNNNTKNPYDYWSYESDIDCYDFMPISSLFKNIEIIENSEEVLIFKGYDDDEYYIFFTFEKLTSKKIKATFNGEDEGGDIYETGFLEKTNDNLNNLEMCN